MTAAILEDSNYKKQGTRIGTCRVPTSNTDGTHQSRYRVLYSWRGWPRTRSQLGPSRAMVQISGGLLCREQMLGTSQA